MRKLENQKGKEGLSASFTIHLSGKPYPTMKWLKNGLELFLRFLEDLVGLSSLSIILYMLEIDCVLSMKLK